MVFAISRKHRNEAGGIQRRAKAFVLTPYQWKSTWMSTVLSEIFRKCKKSWSALFSGKTRRHQNKIHTRVCAKRKKWYFFGWIFDTLTPLASQFCQSRPWSTMPRRVIWMQNKNLSIPPYVWHLKAIFIWTLNLLNLQLQILRYALYLISAIKKVEIFEEIVSTTVDLKKFFFTGK